VSGKAKEKYDKSIAGQYMKYRGTEAEKRRAKIQSGVYSGRGGKFNPRNLRSVVSGGILARSGAFGERVSGTGAQLIDKEFDDEVSRQKTALANQEGMDHSQLMKVMRGENGESKEKRAAAAGLIMSRNYREGHLEALETARQMGASGDSHAAAIQKQMDHDMKDKPWSLGTEASSQLTNGTYGSAVGADGKVRAPKSNFSNQTLDDQIADRVGRKLSGDKIVGLDPDELKRIFKRAQQPGGLDQSQQLALSVAIRDAEQNETLKGRIKGETATVFAGLKSILPPPPPTP
jgi:hypothetical protein